ncbi:MAG: GNAT family N-acetyltransferase [Firmicutes bacterium]|nr:GNAT family N-acetyltransferase [Bacillota bacterium]
MEKQNKCIKEKADLSVNLDYSIPINTTLYRDYFMDKNIGQFGEYIEPITMGDYTVRLLKNENELKVYQDLRYKYLVLEFDPNKKGDLDTNTDFNLGYDKETSQLCVFYDNPNTNEQELVGGYILMRFKKDQSFCKASLKYDLSKLLKNNKHKILETTRAVTHPNHRNGLTINLLWKGIESYCKKYNLRYIIGTLSFSGTDPHIYSQAASYLFHNYLMPSEFMVTPLDKPKGAAFYHTVIPKDELDTVQALKEIPPLLKGYLMIGSNVGTGFYIDKELNTAETFTILDLENYGKYRLK